MKNLCCSEDLLEKQGMEMTPHRRQVLEILRSARGALTPGIILEKIRRRRAFDKVTLYRTLDFFVSRRLVRRIATTAGELRYEITCAECAPAHPHFVCRECGDLRCLDDIDLSFFRNDLKSKHKIGTADIDLKLEGVCLRCQKISHHNHERKAYAGTER